MQWLPRINQIIAGLAGFLLVMAIVLFIWPTGTLQDPVIDSSAVATPADSINVSVETLEGIGNSILKLESEPPSLQLPDLRRHLLYYGANRRPDALASGQQWVHLSLRGTGGQRDVRSIQPREPVYLSYVQGEGRGSYTFSADNAETGLWIQVEPNQAAKSAEIQVRMRDQNDNIVEQPDDLHRITLRERPLPRYGSNRWELDGQRVDAGILSRQKARWYGLDRFMIDHGGAEVTQAKQRIQFGADDNIYVVDVKPGDYLVWRESRWQQADNLEETIGLPLLQLAEVSDRQLQFDLWDGEGKFNVKVRLNKARERWDTRRIQRDFRFAGARTRSRMNLDIGDQRVVVQPQDWILLTDDGAWVPVDTEDRLNSYLNNELAGQLLVIDGIERVEGQQALVAHLFSPSRSDRKEIRFLSAEPFVIIDGSVPPQLQEASTPSPTPTPSAVPTPQTEVPVIDEDDEGDLPFRVPEGMSPDEVRERWREFRGRGAPNSLQGFRKRHLDSAEQRIAEMGAAIRLKPAYLRKRDNEA